MSQIRKENENSFLEDSYFKIAELLKHKITKEKLETFIKENPGLIVKISAESMRKIVEQSKEPMAIDPTIEKMQEAELLFHTTIEDPSQEFIDKATSKEKMR